MRSKKLDKLGSEGLGSEWEAWGLKGKEWGLSS